MAKLLQSLCFVFLSVISFQGLAQTHSSAIEEQQKVQTLWSDFLNQELDPIVYFQAVNEIDSTYIDLTDRLKLMAIENSFATTKSYKRIALSKINESEIDKFAAEFSSLQNSINIEVSSDLKEKIINAEKKLKANTVNGLSNTDIKNLLNSNLERIDYNQGEYDNTVRLFLLCREDRSYPCRFIMKNIYGDIVMDGNDIWSIPALAKSRNNIPYYKSNGHTPTGVHRMDSVMPHADQTYSFGKFRRVILNWVPKARTQEFLPETHKTLTWWKQASTARNNGRLYLRIHGTGKINGNRRSTYYPHMPTSGCISTREGRYTGVEYKDQRVILDSIMEASQLAPVYSNESSIKGVLYVLNINNDKKAVSIDDVKGFIEL